MQKSGLPIDQALTPLAEALRSHRSAVLQAPPGAGKSTVVPLALLEEPWAREQRILLLEPRRLAARAVAQRMAQTLGEGVGRTVGYRMRMDTRVSRDTRIEVITEGILTRMLQSDPALEGVAAVLFDEFHERSLQADLGLALALDARENLTPELRIVVMSATLEIEAVARLLGNAPLVTASGRLFPVETRFAGKGPPALPASTAVPSESPERVVSQLVLRAVREESGDVLVFLPGAPEIRRVQSTLAAASLEPSVRVLPLFGELGGEEQDAALQPAPPGARKVVLATNIAETSLTIEGVRVVVDSGLVRRSVLDPSTGMSRLETQRISRASAAQRQGRAGRLSAGVCYRAWSEGAHRSLAAFSPPEIVDADLAPLALELAAWGTDAGELRWLDPPPAAMLASARDLLERLGALDTEHRITAHGREMQRIGAHPRLAHMLLKAHALGDVPAAADLAALLSERDLLRGLPGARDADIRARLELLRGEAEPRGVDRSSLQRVRRVARELLREAHGTGAGGSFGGDPGVLLAMAYPDRIGKRRPGAEGRFTLASGRGAYFAEPQGLARQELIVAVDLDDRERDARILLAAPLSRADLDEHFADRIKQAESVEWVTREQAVLARRIVQLDSIVLEEKPLPEIPPEAARFAMLAGIRQMGLTVLPWDEESRALQVRVELVRELGSVPDPWPDLSDAALANTLDTWLAPWLDGVTRREHLARLPLLDALRGTLSWGQQQALDELAPTHLQVPTGSRIRIDYLAEAGPSVAVRLQEVFGLEETPRLAGGRIPVTFQLLSPARRPVQVTRDLGSFWRGAYAEVRKDLRGRYPKHYWPENPLEALPTRGVRRR
jgi:ATP-dependent helicase HrpB